ncbi:hypothetical protein NOVOSPHI9U_290046 [Novosphingobium sp. 9U]|nr:hypothetical protein NOVOSPHI9U_290046 [Novosphingobium sp. 9U]
MSFREIRQRDDLTSMSKAKAMAEKIQAERLKAARKTSGDSWNRQSQ